jgi:hypothetical protein
MVLRGLTLAFGSESETQREALSASQAYKLTHPRWSPTRMKLACCSDLPRKYGTMMEVCKTKVRVREGGDINISI